MFSQELVNSPWHYYVYKHRQELLTTGDWDGKHYLYRASRASDAWKDAEEWSKEAYRWAHGRKRLNVKDSRIVCYTRDWANAWSSNKADHVNSEHQEWRAYRRPRVLAVAMGAHPRLGAGSPLLELGKPVLQQILLQLWRS